MPMQDGTGPFGTGPMGRGMGGCQTQDGAPAMKGFSGGRGGGRGMGRGSGMGRGRGRGMGRGFCARFQGQESAFSPEDETAFLEANIKAFDSRLKAMQKRLDELKKKEA